jgi:hypothetical protein
LDAVHTLNAQLIFHRGEHGGSGAGGAQHDRVLDRELEAGKAQLEALEAALKACA